MTPFHHSNIPTADRISNLPDSFLCHILSFLPTKHAATTSVLSKRWKPVWLLVLTLDLDEETFEDSLSFLHIMHSTIFLRDITLPVHSFRFKCRKYSSCNQNDVNQIVNFALQRGSQNLYLHLNKYYCSESDIELPPNILSCKTLEVLNLNDLNVGDISHLVNLHLPTLKILHMTNVSFRCHEHLNKLLLGCPILEDFETKNSFHMQDLKFEKFKALPNLIKARICECYIPINLVSKAKILSIVPERISTCLGFLQLQLISFDSTLSLFQCLTQLELSFTNDIDFYLRKWFWLIGILKYFPKLRKLIIQDCEDQNLEERYNGCSKVKEPPIIVPECLLSQLKTCCLRSFRGTKCGFEFAKYIIENSKVLDYMIINSKFSKDRNAKSQMLMKLFSCTSGSATCKLLFD